jgi:hypothetical protein
MNDDPLDDTGRLRVLQIITAIACFAAFAFIGFLLAWRG